MSIFELIVNHLNEHIDASSKNIESLTPHIAEALHLLTEGLLNGKTIYCCTDSENIPAGLHFCNQLMNGNAIQRPALPTVFLNLFPNNIPMQSSSELFSRHLDSLGKPDDLLLLIANQHHQPLEQLVITAQEKNIPIIALLSNPNQIQALKLHNSNVIIALNTEHSLHTLPIQFAVCHLLCTLIEEQLFGHHA